MGRAGREISSTIRDQGVGCRNVLYTPSNHDEVTEERTWTLEHAAHKEDYSKRLSKLAGQLFGKAGFANSQLWQRRKD